MREELRPVQDDVHSGTIRWNGFNSIILIFQNWSQKSSEYERESMKYKEASEEVEVSFNASIVWAQNVLKSLII